MNTKTTLRLLAAIGLLAGSLNASAADKLFKNYVYDSPASAYTEVAGYYDCSADIGGNALCLDNVDFIGHKFTAALIFSNSKLTVLSLVSPFDQTLSATAMGAIAKTFRLAGLSDGKSQLDIIELASSTSSNDAFESKLSNYESSAMSGGQVTYTFLEGLDRSKKYSNVLKLLESSPDNVRSAEIMLSGKGPEAALIIRFSFPKLEANKVKAAALNPVESF